jgi:hypothetical protein
LGGMLAVASCSRSATSSSLMSVSSSWPDKLSSWSSGLVVFFFVVV